MFTRLAILITALLALLGLASQASAQEAETTGPIDYSVLSINSDDGAATAKLASIKSGFSPDGISVAINGVEANVVETALDSGTPAEVTFVVDLNGRAADSYIGDVQTGLANAIEALPAQTKVRVITAGEFARIASDDDGSHSAALNALDDLAVDADTSFTKAVSNAANMFNVDGSNRSILVVATGAETNQEQTSALAAVSTSGAQLFLVNTSTVPDASLVALSEASGGFVVQADEGLASVIQNVSEAASQRWNLDFEFSSDLVGREPIEFSSAQGSLAHSFHVSSENSGISNLTPLSVIEESGPPSIFSSKIVFFVSAALAALVIGFGVYLIVNLVAQQRENTIDGVLSSYIGGSDASGSELSQADQLIQSAIVKRAVSAAETFGEKRGFTERVSNMMERADLPLRAGEGLIGTIVAAFVLAGAFFAFTRSFVVAVLVFSFVLIGAFFTLQFLARRRLRKFELQLPDTLQLLSGTLRAGYSLPQGLDAVAKEIAEPMGPELAKAMSEAQLGRDLEESLADVGERMDSPDFAWTVMAVGIQREVGGNLNELLTTVADTITQRERLRGEVKALTAEGRVSAGILSLMPPAIMLAIAVLNGDYIDPLFNTLAGLIMLGLGITAAVIGLLWMKKVITIDA